jgi:CheY-like chemotaxis protein
MIFVLLVDDDRDQLALRRMAFERSGFEVATATSPEEALTAFMALPAEVVLMDLRLPKVEDGRALIRTLRERSPSVRIVVLSGSPEDLAMSPEIGLVDGCLRKPVRSATMLRKVREVAAGE